MSAVPKYCIVVWIGFDKFSIQQTSSINNKKQLDDVNLIDDIPWVRGKIYEEPEGGWELFQGIVLKLGTKKLLEKEGQQYYDDYKSGLHLQDTHKRQRSESTEAEISALQCKNKRLKEEAEKYRAERDQALEERDAIKECNIKLQNDLPYVIENKIAEIIGKAQNSYIGTPNAARASTSRERTEKVNDVITDNSVGDVAEQETEETNKEKVKEHRDALVALSSEADIASADDLGTNPSLLAGQLLTKIFPFDTIIAGVATAKKPGDKNVLDQHKIQLIINYVRAIFTSKDVTPTNIRASIGNKIRNLRNKKP